MTARNRQHTIYINNDAYYTAQKAQEVLNMTYSGLRYQVLTGNIKSSIPKGRKQSYYRMLDVEQVARDLQSYSVQRRNRPVQFFIVKTLEEIKECLEISKLLFGSERGDINKHMNILRKNPETYYAIKDEDQIVGYTAIWPVKSGEIHKLLSQTIPVKISPDDIEIFQEGKAIDLYINVIGVKPGFGKEEKRLYGSRLVSGLVDTVVNLGARGILIDTIAARSNMPDGIRLMKGIGFSEIVPLTPERRTFAIKVKEAGSPFATKYKEKLQQWKSNNQILEN